MRAVIATIETLSLWAGRVAAILLTPLVLAMVYEVLSRYLFDAPTQWAFELSYMMMGAIFLLGLAYALRNDAHVKVDFIHARLPRRAIAVIDLVGYVALIALLGWLTYALFKDVLRVHRTGEGTGLSAWNPPLWPYFSVAVVGFALFTLQVAAKILRNVAVLLGREIPPPGHHPGEIAEGAGTV
ncbi:C4-dicarboxylate ABC transporter substrate-binding protein [Acuticoccus sediminis]|uniref:TRAP transporter small permease protein n=1 Tax=Acuticoccus sediminis TaxID=2184697 RepID=A0A8B2NRR8_9HYPH|nr:TRAP transporter small permease subunit [Acuticoccus sediminis]RAI02576.1 C4-dicarboxylate ABC transporter substrate-binding protein [Acuticoccus sediminis]